MHPGIDLRLVERPAGGHVGEQRHAEVRHGLQHELQHELVDPPHQLETGHRLGADERLEPLGERLGGLPDGLVHRRLVQVGLRGEVAVEVGLGDPDAIGDVAQPGAVQTALQKHVAGGVEDHLPPGGGRQPLAGLVGLLLHRVTVPST